MKIVKRQIVQFRNGSTSNSAVLSSAISNSETLKATTLNSDASLIGKELL